MIYPAYSTVAQWLRDFFGELDAKVQIPPQPVLIAADISPPTLQFNWDAQGVAGAATRNRAGIGIDPLLSSTDLWLLVENVQVNTQDSDIQVRMIEAARASWEATITLKTGTAFSWGEAAGVYSFIDKDASGALSGFQQQYRLNIDTIDVWQDVPGSFILKPGSCFYLLGATDDKDVQVHGTAKIIMT